MLDWMKPDVEENGRDEALLLARLSPYFSSVGQGKAM